MTIFINTSVSEFLNDFFKHHSDSVSVDVFKDFVRVTICGDTSELISKLIK